MNATIFTLRSLREFASTGQAPIWAGESLGMESTVPANVAVISSDRLRFYIHRDDTLKARRIVFFNDDVIENFAGLRPSARPLTIERAYLFSERAVNQPLRLPPAWGQYKSANLISFFACARGRNLVMPRWIGEVFRPTDDVAFWKMTLQGADEPLETFQRSENEFYDVLARWADAWEQARGQFEESANTTSALPSEIELQVPRTSPVTKGLTFSGWWEHLTDVQKSLVGDLQARSFRIRGPAGSGKTLTLELKAIAEAERIRKIGGSPRILYATHSWALADEIDKDIRRLDDVGSYGAIDIVPLLTLAQDNIPRGSWDSGLEVVGDDSYEAKLFQLDTLRSVWEDFIGGDWLTYRSKTSAGFRALLDSPNAGARSGLIWSSLVEFGSVLEAEGIFPGANAEPRYLQLHRANWMMDLPERGDKLVMLQVYGRYYRRLVTAGFMTSDQVVNDFLSYLETFAWNVRRATEGYDCILVDEFHLFNVQEQMALRYLTKNADVYPTIISAADPRQNPWERYSGFEGAGKVATGVFEDDSEHVTDIDMPTVHRFSPEILALVAHLHNDWPNVDFSQEWDMDFSQITSTAEHGPVPTVVVSGTAAAERLDVLDAVASALDRSGRGSQVAVAILDESRFADYAELQDGLQKRTGAVVSLIKGRDDLEPYGGYGGKQITMGPAEYLAGLQFEAVVIAGLGTLGSSGANVGNLRHFVSLLYLSVSRAERTVAVIVNDDDGGLPEVLRRAVSFGVLNQSRGREL